MANVDWMTCPRLRDEIDAQEAINARKNESEEHEEDKNLKDTTSSVSFVTLNSF